VCRSRNAVALVLTLRVCEKERRYQQGHQLKPLLYSGGERLSGWLSRIFWLIAPGLYNKKYSYVKGALTEFVQISFAYRIV
jgi:hypothetical protein